MDANTQEKQDQAFISAPETKFDYDSIETGYYDRVFQRCKGSQSKWHHLKFSNVREHLSDCHEHLDIGCGPGTFLGTLDSDKTSVGVDISKPQIDYADKTYSSATKIFLTIKPGESLPFADGRFDCVTLIELIEHISRNDALELFAEARRVLKPGGRLILTTPNYGSLWPLIEKVVDDVSKLSYKDQHIDLYTKNNLFQLLKEAGFSDVNVGSFLWSGPFWAAINWKLSDAINNLEQKIFNGHGGLLLIGEGKRSK